MRTLFLAAILLAVSASPLMAQDPVYVKQTDTLRFGWDPADPASNPPDEDYKLRMLAQSSPAGVTITEFLTGGPTLTKDVPGTALPAGQNVWFSVRAIRRVNAPGESGDSNVVGPFLRSTMGNPTNLQVTVVPTP